MPYSTTILAAEMSVQATGTPRVGIDDPQRPGPTRKYVSPLAANRALISEISSAINAVCILSNDSGRITTMWDDSVKYPLPKALSLRINLLDTIASASSIVEVCEPIPLETGRT